MSTFSSETAWLCLAVTAALGGLVLCKLKSPGQVGGKGVCLAGLWGGACLLSLSLFWSLILFSLSCFLLYVYLSGQELLPVDQKAVLITVYELFAFISHMGTSTMSGHYVCHIKKEGRWVIYNDHRVCASERPPKDLGYMYFYRRIPS